ncbi:MAG: POTRA domain-containing protein, partial [Candidatus Aminicenantales bacterium]
MKKAVIGFFLVVFPLILFGQETVEKIEIVGNDRVTKETILYYLTAREGDYYSEDVLKKDFRVLWSTGFFSDIKIEKKEGTAGVLVTIAVA